MLLLEVAYGDGECHHHPVVLLRRNISRLFCRRLHSGGVDDAMEGWCVGQLWCSWFRLVASDVPSTYVVVVGGGGELSCSLAGAYEELLYPGGISILP